MSAFPPLMLIVVRGVDFLRRTTHNPQLSTAFLILSCLFLILGCGSDEEVCTSIVQGEAEGTIFVEVVCADPITQPRYDWDENKKVFFLEVKRTLEDQELAWSIVSSANDITPPVQHGVKPSGVGESGSETQLEIGVEYIVMVSRMNELGGINEVGSRKFTIQP